MTEWVERPWGRYLVVRHTPNTWTKTLFINPWARLSKQYHEHRTETWHAPQGRLHALIGGVEYVLQSDRVYHVPATVPHRIANPTGDSLMLVEVAIGAPDEDDIVRLEDDYGRED